MDIRSRPVNLHQRKLRSTEDSDYIRTMTKLITLTIRAEKPIERMNWCDPIRSTFSAVNTALGLVSVSQIKIKRRRPTRAVSTPKQKIPRIVPSLLSSNLAFQPNIWL